MSQTPQLFEVAILEIPSEEALKSGAVPTMVLPPTPVVALDAAAATVQASLKLASISKAVPDATRLQVLVRPFRAA